MQDLEDIRNSDDEIRVFQKVNGKVQKAAKIEADFVAEVGEHSHNVEKTPGHYHEDGEKEHEH